MKINLISCSNLQTGLLPIRLLFAAWLVTAFIAIGCRSIDETPPTVPPPLIAPTTEQIPVPAPTQQANRRTSAVRLPRIEAALKKAVAARLKSWKASIEARDLEKHLHHYAEQLETFYLTTNINRDFVRDERTRAFKEFDTLKLEFINVDVNLEANDAAIVTFDKGWDFKKEASFSNGLVRQEVRMRKIEKQWFIVSEKDLQIYRYQNN